MSESFESKKGEEMTEENGPSRKYNAILFGLLLLAGAVVIAAFVITNNERTGRYVPIVRENSSSVYAFDTWTGIVYNAGRVSKIPPR